MISVYVENVIVKTIEMFIEHNLSSINSKAQIRFFESNLDKWFSESHDKKEFMFSLRALITEKFGVIIDKDNVDGRVMQTLQYKDNDLIYGVDLIECISLWMHDLQKEKKTND